MDACFFTSFFGEEPRHIRRARMYLQEARMGMLEHALAAEHHQAAASMYAERARRLEQEVASYEVRVSSSHGAYAMHASKEVEPLLRAHDREPALVSPLWVRSGV